MHQQVKLTHSMQERACRLAAALAIHTPARAAVLKCCVKPLLDLCTVAVAAPVMHQACWALTLLTQPVGSCNAATQLLALDASAMLLDLLKSECLHSCLDKFVRVSRHNILGIL